MQSATRDWGLLLSLLMTFLLDKLGWFPSFERRKHSRLTVFYRALIDLSAISLDHLSRRVARISVWGGGINIA